MLGKGLESLIPKSNSNDGNAIINNEAYTELPAKIISFEKDSVLDSDFSNQDILSFGKSTQSVRHKKQRNYNKTDSVFHIEIGKIRPNLNQPRSFFDDKKIDELAQSIREFGVIQPIVVSKTISETETGTKISYQIIAGERRFRASKKLGLERIPAIIRQIDSKQKELELSLIENVQRSDLNPIESARAYAKLQDEFGLAQREIAMRVGKSRETIANKIRLLNLPFEMQEALKRNEINESQARTLLSIHNKEKQKETFEDIVRKKTSVHKLRREVANNDPETVFWKKRLEEFFGSVVKIVKRGNKGRIIVHFHSNEELRGILNKLLERE